MSVVYLVSKIIANKQFSKVYNQYMNNVNSKETYQKAMDENV